MKSPETLNAYLEEMPSNSLSYQNCKALLSAMSTHHLDATDISSSWHGYKILWQGEIYPSRSVVILCQNNGSVNAVSFDWKSPTNRTKAWHVTGLHPRPLTWDLNLSVDETLERIRMFLWSFYE